MSALIAILSIVIFIAGLWLYGVAFQVDNDTLSLLIFTGGILLNSLAVFIPFQLTGHSRK